MTCARYFKIWYKKPDGLTNSSNKSPTKMFSNDLLEAINATQFKTPEEFTAAENAKIFMFEIPATSIVTLATGDTVESIREKILRVEDRAHVWVDEAIAKGKEAALDDVLINTLSETIEGMVQDDLFPAAFRIHLRGHKLAPSHLHPRYLEKIVNGKIRPPFVVDGKFPVHKGGQRMTEITMSFTKGGRTKVFIMAGTASNFHHFVGGPMILADEIGVKSPKMWLSKIYGARLWSAEQWIQIHKIAAAEDDEFMLKDLAAVAKSLDRRAKQLKKKFGIDVGETKDVKRNNEISRELFERMDNEADPKVQKDLGRNAAINGDKYFPKMNNLGNALLMASGVLLRLFRGDERLQKFVDWCRRFNYYVFEAAMHGDISGECSGADEDLAWGDRACCQRVSHLFEDVETDETIYSAFGFGFNYVLALSRTTDAAAEAREFLGLPADEPITTITKDVCAAVIAKAHAHIA